MFAAMSARFTSHTKPSSSSARSSAPLRSSARGLLTEPVREFGTFAQLPQHEIGGPTDGQCAVRVLQAERARRMTRHPGPCLGHRQAEQEQTQQD